MAWIESHTVLMRHRKLRELAVALRLKPVYVLGHLHALWHAALEQQEDGNLSAWSDEFISESACYSGDGPQFVSLLQTHGWLDDKVLHDWLDYAGKYLIKKYGTSNRDKLVEIWAKHGRVYGKEMDKRPERDPKQVSKETLHNLTKPNLPTKQQDPKPAAPVFVLPDWVDPTAWADYVAMRVKIRKPMTDRAKSLAIGDLEKLRAQGHDPKLVLEASILNSWAGVFPLKPGQMQASRPKAPPKPMTARERAISEGRWDGMTTEQREALIEAEA